MLSRYRESVRVWTDPIGRALFRLHLRPNHLTVAGLGVSLLTAAAFVAGRERLAGGLLIFAALFDFFDGALARVSGQVTPFGAFLDSVIDRYSDLVVLLGIVVLFARTPHTRGAIVAMAGLVGSVMVSYTKARAESIGIECSVGVMERPERLICLIAGALLDLLEPALWVLAVLANITAIQRIVFTRRMMREAALFRLGLVLASLALMTGSAAAAAPGPEVEQAWARAVSAFQRGDVGPLIREFSADRALTSPIGGYARLLLADAHARRGDWSAARAAAVGLADREPDGRLAPGALLIAAVLADRAGDDAGARSLLKRLIERYPDSREMPEALYLLGLNAETDGQLEAAALAYRGLRVLAPTTGWASGAEDRLDALAAAGVRSPELSVTERMERAERLLQGGIAKSASEEAERIAREAREPDLAVRALRVVADASARMRRYEIAARALEMAAARAPAERRPALWLDQARYLIRAGKLERALTALAPVERGAAEAETAEAAYLRAQTLDELERTAAAAAAYRTVASRYPNREVAGKSLWRLGWLAYMKNDLRGAAEVWLRVGDIPGGRAYRLPALYWAARAREQTDGAAAQRLYRRILSEAPRSYYGVLAARRAAGVAEPSPEPAIRLPADPRAAVGDDPGFLRVELLQRIGLTEFALAELDDVVLRSFGDPVRLYVASEAYARDERYHLALQILRRHFTGLAVSADPSVPRAFWEILYPFGWRAEITAAAERAGIDPHLVAAVIREESRYDPRALSPAGARGLMQLMPRTAELLAEPSGVAFAEVEGLHDPRTNLAIGARFLGDLIKEFGDPRVALAAYNAGPGRARQWWRDRRTNDIEAWVEQIPYDETRLYVKRVMLSWEEYRRIYGAGSQ